MKYLLHMNAKHLEPGDVVVDHRSGAVIGVVKARPEGAFVVEGEDGDTYDFLPYDRVTVRRG